jgi:hypothetical protein
MVTSRLSFRGTWRIIETELWDADDLDDVTEAHLTLGKNNLGELAFLCVSAGVDYRVVQRDGRPAVEFSFNGEDELTPVSGRGWAILDADELRGRLFFHGGDDSAFVARRKPAKRRSRWLKKNHTRAALR